MSRAELIIYATPTGPLADALADLFAELARRAPTTAQTYPPHCTLTGFFRRDRREIDRIRAEVTDAVATTPPGSVTINQLRATDTWVGLELTSPWLLAFTAAFVDVHRLGPGDDPLRPKDWLHLSIAYGEGDLAAAAPIATTLDLDQPVGWEIGLWEREPDGMWTALSR